jgi:hypothetical protein
LQRISPDDADKVVQLEALFSFLVPFGFVGLPLSGYILDYKGLSANFFLTNTILLLMHITALVEADIRIQIMTFILWILARFFLFSSYFAYLPAVFGFKTFGCGTFALLPLYL